MRRACWLAAGLLLFAAAVAAHIAQAVIHPQWYWQQTDAGVYRAAGAAVLGHHGMLYSLRLGSPGLPFTYPPFAALLFASVSPFSFASWQYALTAASILALPVIAYVSLGLARREAGAGRLGRRQPPAGRSAGREVSAGRLAGALALAAVSLWLEPVQKTLLFGQLNLLLLVLVMADFAGPDTRRWKGAGIGIAAGIKLTPLIFIPYLYMTRRRRAALTGLAAFVATVVLGFILLPRDSAAYWGGGFAKLGDRPERLVNQSINGVIQRTMHGGSAALAGWLVLAGLTIAVGLAVAAAAGRHGRELLAIVVCGVTELLVSPISWTHHWVYVVPALALAASQTTRAGGAPRDGDRRPPMVSAPAPALVPALPAWSAAPVTWHARGWTAGQPRPASQRVPASGSASVSRPIPVGPPNSPPRPTAQVPRRRLVPTARLASGAAVFGLFGMWPAHSGPNGYYDRGAAFMPRGFLRFAPHNFGREYHWHGMELIVGNYYVLAGIVFVAAAAVYLAVDSNKPSPAAPVKPGSTACG
jgi:alpha-1,2-mannosyltransferase